ncbi:MAG: CIA30 family protein [Pseudomonadota bacterium]
MSGIKQRLFAATLLAGLAMPGLAAERVLEDFTSNPEQRWDYVADTVMGGVSEGQAIMAKIDGKPGMHLTGEVSTKNNGGFIQVRRFLPDGLPEGTAGLEMEVRGNGESYYVYLRTTETTRQWFFYNVAFSTTSKWETIRIPIEAFKRSHAHLSEEIDPQEVISIHLAAYGKDYEADLMVREIRLF